MTLAKCKNCKHDEERNHLIDKVSEEREFQHIRYEYDNGQPYPAYTKKCKYCNCIKAEPETEAKE